MLSSCKQHYCFPWEVEESLYMLGGIDTKAYRLPTFEIPSLSSADARISLVLLHKQPKQQQGLLSANQDHGRLQDRCKGTLHHGSS